MIDDMFVFDCAIHAYDLSDANVRAGRPDAEVARQHMLGIGGFVNRTPDNFQDTVGKRWTHEELYEMVFVKAPTDLAMAQVVPIFEWFEDWFAPVKAQHEFAAAYPEQVLFCGGVDPLYQGVEAALGSLEHQVRELGAVSLKFYNGHQDRSWRADDQELAYPLFQKAQDLGIKVVQFHKGFPFGLQNLEDLNPLDLQRAARDFPELIFVLHHLATPYFDEAVSIAGRFPNVYLALSGNLCLSLLQPRLVQEQLGRLLLEVGVDKLFWGSEAALLGGPAPYLAAFMDLEIPEDLRSGYGYPQVTREDKEKILGLNFARVMGIDVEERKRRLAGIPA